MGTPTTRPRTLDQRELKYLRSLLYDAIGRRQRWFGLGARSAGDLDKLAEHYAPYLPRYAHEIDEMLRRGPAWDGTAEPWFAINTSLVSACTLDSPTERLLVGLIASHHDGRVREAAVRRLGEAVPSDVLPFLLLRANDWVPQVRLAATGALTRHLHAGSVPGWIDVLPALDRLHHATRGDHRALILDVHRLLRSPAVRPQLIAGLSHANARVRRLVMVLLADVEDLDVAAVVHQAAADRDTVVRTAAISLAQRRLADPDRADYLRRACTDAFPAVRQLAWEHWHQHESAEAERLTRSFLFDRTPSLRSAAQLARSHRGDDVARLYRAALDEPPTSQQAAVIDGLGETGQASDAELVTPFLSHPRARVRCAALRALHRLTPQADVRPYVRALVSDSASVAGVANRCLVARRGDWDIETVWQEAMQHDDVARRRVLVLSGMLDKWTQLRYLCAALEVGDDTTRAFVTARLHRWCERFNRSAVQPTPGIIAHLTNVVPKLRFRMSPELLDQLVFLLRGPH